MNKYIEQEVAIKALMNDAPEKVSYCREDALTIPVRKRTRGYRPSASCGAKMDGGEC